VQVLPCSLQKRANDPFYSSFVNEVVFRRKTSLIPIFFDNTRKLDGLLSRVHSTFNDSLKLA